MDVGTGRQLGKKLVVGNWKMNGTHASATALVTGLVTGLRGLEVDAAVCVPFPLLEHVACLAEGAALQVGAQDVSTLGDGAYTGEVSASMLRDTGCRVVIVGHSERRARHHETDDAVAAKVRQALAHGLTPVVCVGETLPQRVAGDTQQVVLAQLEAVVAALGPHPQAPLIVAYEPVWAIGTGRSASPTQAQEVHAAIRQRLGQCSGELAARTRVLYGGSVKPATAATFFAEPDIDGALVGGASLDAHEFLNIARAAAAARCASPGAERGGV